jgi:hypothetical protein
MRTRKRATVKRMDLRENSKQRDVSSHQRGMVAEKKKKTKNMRTHKRVEDSTRVRRVFGISG